MKLDKFGRHVYSDAYNSETDYVYRHTSGSRSSHRRLSKWVFFYGPQRVVSSINLMHVICSTCNRAILWTPSASFLGNLSAAVT